MKWLTVIALVVIACRAPAQDMHARLRAELERIHGLDQRDRENIGRYGVGTAERDSVNHHLIFQDSLNTLRVRAILDSAGWLGPEEVGASASSALFLVIQHADLATQETYLPEARLAVEEGKLAASSLALLEDRIEMRNGRPQIYGSQVRMANGKSTLWAIRDEETVNERRASVGLGPLEEYAARFGINWSPAKKQDRLLLLGPVKE
ncbi:MAG: hypothetical protein KA352_13460 [Flavobacteriales bacterium]|nr:hypothetical protein [Flavobacteriales bacterium]